MELVLGSCATGIDHKCDLVLFGNPFPRCGPGDFPDGVRPLWIFDACDQRARYSEAVHEAGSAAAHFQITDNDEVRSFFPDRCRILAFAALCALAFEPRKRTTLAVIRNCGIDAACDDSREHIPGFGSRRLGCEDCEEQETKNDGTEGDA